MKDKGLNASILEPSIEALADIHGFLPGFPEEHMVGGQVPGKMLQRGGDRVGHRDLPPRRHSWWAPHGSPPAGNRHRARSGGTVHPVAASYEEPGGESEKAPDRRWPTACQFLMGEIAPATVVHPERFLMPDRILDGFAPPDRFDKHVMQDLHYAVDGRWHSYGGSTGDIGINLHGGDLIQWYGAKSIAK